MNYHKIYQDLVERAKSREPLRGYYEKHHIIPRCLGGLDEQANLVSLTAREHYIAHLCLVKMHPGNSGLAKAAMMMSVCKAPNQGRLTNRIYDWLRTEHSKAMSLASAGENNSQFGKVWVYHKDTRVEKKVSLSILESYLDLGWTQGRATTKMQCCSVCGSEFYLNRKRKTCSKECQNTLIFQGKVFVGREEEFLNLYRELGSMNKALKSMGFKGAVSHYHRWAKSLLAS